VVKLSGLGALHLAIKKENATQREFEALWRGFKIKYFQL
jgi:hypothetical protein